MIERVSTRSRPRRLAAALLAAAALLTVTGCTTSSARTTGTSDGDGVVGIALPTAADAQWARAGDALASELRERGYSTDLQFAAADPRTQGSQVQNMLTKGADALVVAPLSVDDLDPALQTAAADALPVVALERALDLPGLGFAAAIDPEALGRAQAQALLSAIGATEDALAEDGDDTPIPDATALGDGSSTGTEAVRLAILGGAPDDVWALRRHDAAVEALTSAVAAGALTIVAGATAADAAVAGVEEIAVESRVRALLAADAASAPTAILALSDAATRGVVTALTTAPEDPTPAPTASATDGAAPSPTGGTATPPLGDAATPAPRVVGSGADTVTVRALRDGVVEATVFADPRELVAWVADAVQALLDGEPPRVDGGSPAGLDGIPSATVSASVVRDGDIERLLIATGWLTAADVSG